MRAGTTAVAPPVESGKSVVLDLTTDDPQDPANPRCEREVVIYERGLALVVCGRSALTDDVTQALARSPARVVQRLRDREAQPETTFKSHNRTLRPVRRFDKHVTGRRPL